MTPKITINLHKSAWALALAVVGVAGLSACSSIVNYFVLHSNNLPPQFTAFWQWYFMSVYLDAELNFPTWYASITLLICATLLAFTAWHVAQTKAAYFRHWALLAILFVFLSIDEYIGFHEEIGSLIRDSLHLTGIFWFAWVLPGAVFVIIVGLAYIPFFFHFPSRIRNLMILSAVIFVGGALCVEALQGYYVYLYSRANLGYELSVYVEETMEMAGIALFTYVLLENLKNRLNHQALELAIE